jgi:hypothetical protein
MSMADEGSAVPEPVVQTGAVPPIDPAAQARSDSQVGPGRRAEPAPQAPPQPQPEPPAASAPQPQAPPQTPQPEPPHRETIADAIADLLQMAVNWLRAEASDIMRDKVVLPGQQLGMTIAAAFAAATLLVVGLLFLFVAFLMVLARFVGWAGAFAIVGTCVLIGAGIFTYLKVRSIQK